jgi:dTDP-4-dehydrorhamnose reductase
VKILVTGASGGLGRYVMRALEPFAAEIHHPSSEKFDVVSLSSVEMEAFTKPSDVVVHLAAMTNTAECEIHPHEAVALNTLATQKLVRACVATGTRLVFMSTDAVFSHDGPYSTRHIPAPDSVYGWSKLAAEQAVATMEYDGLIVRANFFTRHCRGKQSFASYVLTEAKAGRRFMCFSNIQSTPVFAQTLAERIAQAIVDEEHGILHVASADAVNRVEQAAMICDAYGLAHDIDVETGKKHDGRLVSAGASVTVREEIAKMAKEEA